MSDRQRRFFELLLKKILPMLIGALIAILFFERKKPVIDRHDEVAKRSAEILKTQVAELLEEQHIEEKIEAANLALNVVEYDGYYYDYESVILYLDAFGKLPSNYITKTKAKKLGWEGGPVDSYFPGGAIGGGKFGNNEGLLPEGDGIQYYECDIDTAGESSRGAKRLIYSNEPKYYYTTDHYGSFTRFEVVDGKVVQVEN